MLIKQVANMCRNFTKAENVYVEEVCMLVWKILTEKHT